MKRITILGSTGSVGRQALDVATAAPDRVRVVGLTAGKNVAALISQLDRFEPEIFAVEDAAAGESVLQARPGWKSRCAGFGAAAIREVAAYRADMVVNALLGYAGLRPTLAALDAGIDVALANKETMVVAGTLVCRSARRHGARIVPVDSEHSAIFQCLRAGSAAAVRRLILTASGGPFRTKTRAELEHVTTADALRHPTWNMGAKITVDSATMMNKGLEVIEARSLFDIDYDRIDIVVHPQSIVHSMVEFVDGSVMAQMGTTDMRLPVWVALFDPQREPNDFPRLDLARTGTLSFEDLDAARFPCVGLAVAAGKQGGIAPAVLNAANEVAVAAFLDGKIRFGDIPRLIRGACEAHTPQPASTLDAVLAADRWSRDWARQHIYGHHHSQS